MDRPLAHRRIVTALVVAALAAVAIGGASFVLKEEATEPAGEDASVAEASVDARAKAAKPKPSKKKAGRGGTTRVAAHGSGGGHGGGGGADRGPAVSGGPSYEAALDSNDEQLTIGHKTGPDLTDAQLSAPMRDGTFLDDCEAPESMGVTVKVAIKMGRAVGVSVNTNPPSAEVAGCIDRHVRQLSWPASPKMDSFVTTY